MIKNILDTFHQFETTEITNLYQNIKNKTNYFIQYVIIKLQKLNFTITFLMTHT